MKIYLDNNEIAKTVTFEYENDKRQKLYVHDDEGFVFKSLEEHDEQTRKDVCDEISSAIAYEVFKSEKLTHIEIERAIEKVKKNIYGIRR